MRLLRRAALLLPLLALGCEGPLLSGYVEIPQFGLLLANEQITGAPLGGTVSEEFQLDIGSQIDLDQPGATIELRLEELRLDVVTDPAPDLSNVASVAIYTIPPGGGDAVLLASYARDPANPSPSSLRAKGNADADLLQLIETGLIQLRADIATDGPTPTFVANVEAVFYLKIEVDFLEALNGTS